MVSTHETTITLTSHCLCNSNTFTVEVSKSELPLPASICHCTSCRHVTGSLYSTFVRWPESRTNVDTSKLKAYPFTRRVNILFCPMCSTPMFWDMLDETDCPLGAFTGTLTNDNVTSIKFTQHIFVSDTVDGGASVWLQHPSDDGSECRRFKFRAKDSAPENALPQDWPPPNELTGYEKRTENSIYIRCKCKGIDFSLHQDNYSNMEKEQLPCNVDPETHKLSTVFCGCDSCRLQGGIDMWFWAYFEMKNLSSTLKGEPFPKSSHELKSFIDKNDPVVGSLAYYASSTNVLRFFCNVCSATVFFAEEDRPELLDVSVGLLDAPDGARAEGHLSWAFGKIDFKEDAHGGWRERLFGSAEREAEKWRVARRYPKNWRRLAKEQERSRSEE